MASRLTVITTRWKLRHYLLSLSITAIALFLIIELRNASLIWWFYETSDSVLDTVTFSATLLGGLFTLFSPIGTVSVIVFSLLLGVQVVLLWQLIRRQRALLRRTHATSYSVIGTTIALIGIGCASCGLALLFSLLSFFGATSLLIWLPLHGEEFSLIGIALMFAATWYTLGRLNTPLLCT